MAFVAIADRDHEHALHDPETFIRKYIWSQDHKVIAIQYALVAIAIGLVALVMSVLMRLQLGFPDTFSLISPQDYAADVDSAVAWWNASARSSGRSTARMPRPPPPATALRRIG